MGKLQAGRKGIREASDEVGGSRERAKTGSCTETYVHGENDKKDQLRALGITQRHQRNSFVLCFALNCLTTASPRTPASTTIIVYSNGDRFRCYWYVFKPQNIYKQTRT